MRTAPIGPANGMSETQRAAEEFSRRRRFFAVIDRQREIILAFLDSCGRDRAGHYNSIAARDNDRAVRESGDFAGFDGDVSGPNLGRDLLLHFTFLDVRVPGRSP